MAWQCIVQLLCHGEVQGLEPVFIYAQTLAVRLGTMQVLQRLHESPNALQAIRAVWMAKVSLPYTLCLHAWHQH